MILFTNTVSHKMVISASQEAKRNNVPVARVHSSSACATCMRCFPSGARIANVQAVWYNYINNGACLKANCSIDIRFAD